MTTQSSPTVEDHWAAIRTIDSHVIVEDMIAPECLRESFSVETCQVLLPVKPPEVYSLLLPFTDDMFKQRTVECGILQHPWHTVACQPHISPYLIEMIFMTGNAISRMKVQTHLESLIMHPSDQTVRIGYEVFIPSPPCPSVQMPVHIHNHYVERNFVIMNFVYQIDIVLLRVSLILTVPITQRIEWWHGLSASYLDIVANSSFIVVSISHEIPIERIGIYRLCPPVNTVYLMLKSKGHRPIPTLCARRLVYQCPSAPRDDAIFQVGTLVIAAGSVQRTLRTFQVECILLTGVPDDIPAIEMHGNAQVVRRFQTCGYCTTYFVAKRQCRCLDVEIAAFLSCTIIDERETAVDDCKCSSVFKLFTDTILNANHPVSKNGEACTT